MQFVWVKDTAVQHEISRLAQKLSDDNNDQPWTERVDNKKQMGLDQQRPDETSETTGPMKSLDSMLFLLGYKSPSDSRPPSWSEFYDELKTHIRGAWIVEKET